MYLFFKNNFAKQKRKLFMTKPNKVLILYMGHSGLMDSGFDCIHLRAR